MSDLCRLIILAIVTIVIIVTVIYAFLMYKDLMKENFISDINRTLIDRIEEFVDNYFGE